MHGTCIEIIEICSTCCNNAKPPYSGHIQITSRKLSVFVIEILCVCCECELSVCRVFG